MTKENKKINKNLSTKQIIFGVLMIIVSLVMIYYGFTLGFNTISSVRFILGGIFIFILAITVFKNMINTKPVGIILAIYLLLDILLTAFFSKIINSDIILEIGFLIVVVYYVFIKKK